VFVKNHERELRRTGKRARSSSSAPLSGIYGDRPKDIANRDFGMRGLWWGTRTRFASLDVREYGFQMEQPDASLAAVTAERDAPNLPLGVELVEEGVGQAGMEFSAVFRTPNPNKEIALGQFMRPQRGGQFALVVTCVLHAAATMANTRSAFWCPSAMMDQGNRPA
jgi:hypothetical protein